MKLGEDLKLIDRLYLFHPRIIAWYLKGVREKELSSNLQACIFILFLKIKRFI